MATVAAMPGHTNIHNDSNTTSTHKPNLLASSPYLDDGHLLDLNTLDTQSRLLALALTTLRTKGPNYATVKYEDGLDLDGIVSELKTLAQSAGVDWVEQDFYVVEFRSHLRAEIDNALLFKLDKESHREANISGGLLSYWYGEPDANRRNLATCFWTNKDAAIAGGKGPLHKQARAITAQMYEFIEVKGLRFTIQDDVEGWTLGPHIQS